MKQTSTAIIVVLLLWICGLSVYAQSAAPTTSGKEFHITYLASFNDIYGSTLQLKVVVEKACYITARYNATGNYLNGWNNNWVNPGIHILNVSNNDVINNPAANTGIPSFKTITLVSAEDVCVYAINHSDASTDATCVLPVSAWGTEYRLATGVPLSSALTFTSLYAVVASQDNTEVTLHNNTSITLNQGQVYHVAGVDKMDMTGQKITADKRIGVFSGTGLTLGPGQPGSGCSSSNFPGGATADHTYEQLWSIDKWGTEFLAFPMRTPGGGNPIGTGNWGGMLAIVADQNSTNITLSGGIVDNHTLQAGEKWYTCTYMTGLTKITSDKPIMVFLILPDATVTTIQPINQQIKRTIVSPFILSGDTSINQHGIDILVPAAYWDQMVIKHNGVDSISSYTPTPSVHFPDWYHIRKDLPNVNVDIEITCPGGFQAYVSGSGSAESYAFSAGNLPWHYFTIQEKGTTNDTYYENTAEITHTFEPTDTIIVKRTVDAPFIDIYWLINNIPYMNITDNTNSTNILRFPASALSPGENTITMMIRWGTVVPTGISMYTGSVWKTQPFVRGTVFPFAYMNYPALDTLPGFTITASLYDLPPAGLDDPIDHLLNNMAPVQTVKAVRYDGSIHVPGTPRNPGYITGINQPGVPINWSRIGKDTTIISIDTTTVSPNQFPVPPVGIFTFEDLPVGNEYILHIHRASFLSRFAKVTITAQGYLGHRFLIPGDINGNGRIDSQDFSILNSVPSSTFFSPVYDAAYDLNADGFVNPSDVNILRDFLNSSFSIYTDTYDWIIEYYLQ